MLPFEMRDVENNMVCTSQWKYWNSVCHVTETLYLLLTSILILYVFGILWLIFHLTRYSNMFVTSPSPENLHTLFEFVFKGFDALEYQVCLKILDQGAFFS